MSQHRREKKQLAGPKIPTFFESPLDSIKKYLFDYDSLVLFGILLTLFFMPLHEKLKAAGFWLALLIWITKLWKGRENIRIWVPPLAWVLFIFVGVALLSGVFSDYPNRATRGALDALRNTFFFLMLCNTANSPQRIKAIIFALMGGMVIGDFAGIHKYLALGPELEMLSLGEKNSTAQVLGLFLALLLGLVLTMRRSLALQTSLLGVAALTGFALILTYARGIWVAVLAMLVIFGFIRKDWKVPVILVLLVGTVLAGMTFSNRLTDKVASLKHPLNEPNMLGRYEFWKESLDVIADRPFLGIGLKTYGFYQANEKYHLSSSHAHNIFLNVMVELGLAGLITLAGWFLFYWRALLNMRNSMHSDLNQGLWLGGIGCFVLLLVGGITHPMLGSESSLILMTTLGLMFSGYRMENSASVLVSSQLYKIPGTAGYGQRSTPEFLKEKI